MDSFIQEFLEPDTDFSVDDNLRWAIMKKIILKILETCELPYLAEVMIMYTKKFEEVLKKPFIELRDNPIDFYLLIREK